MADTLGEHKDENNTATQCHYFVQRKKRLCRMTVRPGKNYCGEHDPTPKPEIEGEQNYRVDLRVPCPLDPKHTCYASKLEKHLKICNARERSDRPSCIQPGVNANSAAGAAARVPLKEVPVQRLQLLIDKIQDIYQRVVAGKIVSCSNEGLHEAVRAEYELEGRGHGTRKHLHQASALLRLLEREDLVRPHTCYVELGAGKGHLSYYVSQAVSSVGGSVLLVDRASHRHKQDNKLDRSQHVVARLRADIRDLMLARAEPVQAATAIVGLSKHLCGAATDYALRCVTAPAVLDKTLGLVMATCCHHRCAAHDYVALHQLQNMGVTSDDFTVMLGVVSWATCGSGYSRERRLAPLQHNTKRQKTEHTTQTNHEINENDEDGGTKEGHEINSTEDKAKHVPNDETKSTDHKVGESDDLDYNSSDSEVENMESIFGEIKELENRTSKVLNLSVAERTEIGRQAKAILDYGRILFLEERGFSAKLCYYVGVEVSPENVCIVAKKPSINQKPKK